jgi:hypothetical protein
MPIGVRSGTDCIGVIEYWNEDLFYTCHSTKLENMEFLKAMERHRRRQPYIRNYWAQWKSLAVRNGVLEDNWESSNRQSQRAQIVLSRSRMKNVQTELRVHGGSSGHLGVNKP